MRVLLVEDDTMIGQALSQALQRAGDAVDWVRDGAKARDFAASSSHDVVLLDIGLPDQSGFSVLDALRRGGSDVPVLVITARDALEDRVHGLDLGADDYLIKPFDPAELMARMRAVVRRRHGVRTSQLEADGLMLDLASHELTYKERTCVLPTKEFALMRALMERPGTILSRGQLESRLYSWQTEIESNAVDVLIHSIRRRFEKDVVRNVRGAGWMVSRRRG